MFHILQRRGGTYNFFFRNVSTELQKALQGPDTVKAIKRSYLIYEGNFLKTDSDCNVETQHLLGYILNMPGIRPQSKLVLEVIIHTLP